MIAMRRLVGRFLLAAAVAGGAWLAWPRPPLVGTSEAAQDSPAGEAGARDLRWMGVASCASSACHHQNGPRGSKRSEYTTWAGYDRHARAFQVLYEERSERMVQNLYGAGARPATETTLCLKCHATGDGDTRPARVGPRFYLGDGVGCESCHGPAER